MEPIPPPPPPPPDGGVNGAGAPAEIEAMAERAVADLEGNDVVPMETEPTSPAPPMAATNPPQTFENQNPPLASPVEATLNDFQPPPPAPQVPPAAPATMDIEPATPAATAEPPADVPPAAAATETTPSANAPSTPAPAPATSEKPKKSNKRKTARTVRRVLVAKKEMEAATQVMTGLRDISKVLDHLDAKFLGEQYWIFTQHQLAWLIQSVSAPKAEENQMDTEPLDQAMKELEKDLSEPEPNVEGNAAPASSTANGEKSEPGPDWKARRDMLLASMAAGLKFESSTVVTAAVQADESGIAKEISIASREDAEKRLIEWEEKLKAIEGNPFQVEEESFSLDGPMNFLMPKGFKNFLDSIEIKTLYQFLSLKKTETGALCELYALWRHTCKLAKVTAPAAVRYFLGLHARLEGAVTAVPPCDEKKRRWMNNTIVVMTGASLEFLVEDRGIYTARDFVDARTKDLSLQLAAWRESKKLEPLKGSGKVAMISGWKAVAKEIIVMEESGNGEVVPNLKLMASSDLYLEEDPRPKRAKTAETGKAEADPSTPASAPKAAPAKAPASAPPATSETGRRTSRGGGKAEYDLHSKLFLEQVLGIEVTEFLALASIHTAAQLFESESKNDETLLKAMVDAEEAKDIESAPLILKAWTEKLRENLEASAPSKKKGRPQGKAIKPETLKDASDPYDLMSDVTRKFLATMDIHTAEKFLSTRTTEIAAEFVKFRKKEGMAELKGLGSIASVSGWKANCRRFARAMGREDIANLEPPEKSQSSSKRPVPMKAAIIQSVESSTPSSTMTHPGVLFGKSRRMFAVQGESDTPMQFRFDVSLRNDVSGFGIGLYLTYKGSGPSIRSANVARLPRADSTDTIPLLVDTTLTKSGDNEVDARSLFASERTGCGLIDLQKYGVRPLKDQDLTVMKKALQSFFGDTPIEKPAEPIEKAKFNVCLRRIGVDKCQYLAVVGDPMQAGQTISIVFPEVNAFLVSPPSAESGDFADRNLLMCSLFLLSRDDLEKLSDFIFKEIVPSISLDSEDVGVLKKSVKMQQRVDLILRRIIAQLPDSKGNGKDKLKNSITTLMASESIVKLADETFNDLAEAVRVELSDTLLSLIENDSVLGKAIRKTWCPLAKELYDDILGIILSAVVSKRSEEQVDYKAALGAAFKRATELSLDSDIIPKLAFTGSPLDEPSESDAKVVVCSTGPVKKEEEEGSTKEEKKPYAAIPLEEIEKPSEKSFYSTSPDVSFYRAYLAKIVVKTVKVFSKITDPSDFAADDVLDSFKLADVMSPDARASIAAPWNMPVSVPSDPAAMVQPHTEQFFLGIVWPILREFGWRIEVESFPSERVFAAPKWKGDQQKLGKLAKLAKTHRDRRRQNLAREVNQIGFGAISKLTKRLFVASGGMTKEADALGKPAGGRKLMTVRKVCDSFIESIEEAAKEKDDVVLGRVKEIVDQVVECFDSLAPEIQSTTVERGPPSEKYGADVFMQFLLVLPALLGRADVELQVMNDSLELVHELTAFMTHNNSVFPAAMRPSPEVYMTKGKRVPSSLLTRLEHKSSSGQNKTSRDELTEVLWDEDAEELSDFVVNVMKQTLACRATEADVARKFRRIHVGYPGVVCRHCMGEGGEGRYFFTTIESLTTLSTVFEKHVAKCAFVPADVKKSVVTARAKHAEQRKAFPNGAQQAYFNRLWDRLRTLKIAGTTSSSAVPLAKTNGSAVATTEDVPSEMAAHSDEKMTFSSSLDVLDFVRTSAPWKGTKEIEEALNQYYNCLDYGGRIYMTKSMPDHFSSAWLLNKVVPRRSRTAIKRHLPG